MITATATKIEAILYLKGKPLSLGEIAEYAACDRATVKEGIIELMDNYAHRDSALEVIETPDGYSLQLRSDFHDLVQTMIPVELGVGALRTLAAIALNSPILQTDLINLRGSGVYQHVPELVELGFIRKRRDSDSRSYSLQVTPKFHQYFQIEQLPQILSTSQKEEQLELELELNGVGHRSWDMEHGENEGNEKTRKQGSRGAGEAGEIGEVRNK